MLNQIAMSPLLLFAVFLPTIFIFEAFLSGQNVDIMRRLFNLHAFHYAKNSMCCCVIDEKGLICIKINKENTIDYEMKKSERKKTFKLYKSMDSKSQICLTFYQRYSKHARMPA